MGWAGCEDTANGLVTNHCQCPTDDFDANRS